MKKTIKLRESDLHNIIANAINEVAGTPSKDTLRKYDNIYYGNPKGDNVVDNDYLRNGRGDFDRIGNAISNVENGFYQVLRGLDLLRQGRIDGNRFSDEIRNTANKGIKLVKYWKNKELSKLGEQPDVLYDVRHEKQDKSYYLSPEYMAQQERLAFGSDRW